MTLPDIVQSALGDEGVAARVDFGDDALFVTPTRSILYRGDKLLSDESVEEFPHGAERLTVSTGRRKATVTLDYGLDGERSFTVPAKAVDRALHPVLAGTLNAVGVTDPGETVRETFRFSELTLVVTSDRLVKHVGNAVWDEEFEEFHYDDITDLAFEEGSVATTLVVTLGERQERFKTPNERAREVRERLTEAVLDYHGVDSVATLRERFAVEDSGEDRSATMSFGEGPTPLSVNPGELSERPRNATRNDDGGEATGATGTTDADASANTDGESTMEADPDRESAVDGAGREEEPVEASGAAGPVDGARAADATTKPVETPPEASEPAATTETAETSETVPGGESEAAVTSEERNDAVGTGSLLGPVDGSDEGAATAGRSEESDGAAEADADVAVDALVAEVRALRESVEAQNERLDRQEETIERLVVELRERL